ncbi:putative thymine dioxygenase protein [Phaeoacremonium minimum UCRPA7]|uniref:Putative thymine dioxygenase protein n=1 Tax=Phaeoacremonium minimum (strain UCR-PA7) TaxID=1286976 RepID=R8BSC6_PHAM7|nr:putative thymine dioxygenase protein [Phaeoacremonium minimum UCRPA7]EOO02229.1 putative thymine dioxygenase protein [Phaeoacremonium minimum UCRPA7]
MEKAAVEDQGLLIPLIDFSKFLEGDEAQKKETADAILRGFQTAGFIYLKNIPVTPETRKHVFDTSAKLFRLPLETKLAHGWTTPEANRGYSAPGREKVTQLKDLADVAKLKEGNPDIKESFEIGREGEPDHPNQWPPEEGEMVGFKSTMLDFHDQCKALHVEVMRAIAVGMNLDAGFFDDFVDVGDNTLRLLHYPAVNKEIFKINPGQDSAGGLQVKSPNGKFVDATPIENTCVVNAGDLLARWSNDTIKSTIHRVVEPPHKDSDVYPARYSIAYFCNPNFKSHIEAIPGTFATETEKKYDGINSGQYLVQRLAATY